MRPGIYKRIPPFLTFNLRICGINIIVRLLLLPILPMQQLPAPKSTAADSQI